MRIATRITHEITLEDDEVFDIQAPAAYSGCIVSARISQIRITRLNNETLSWRLFGYKIKRDGSESQVRFEYWSAPADASDVWQQIPGDIRARLPHSTEFARTYFGKQES